MMSCLRSVLQNFKYSGGKYNDQCITFGLALHIIHHFSGNPLEIPIQFKFFENILILQFYKGSSRNGFILTHFGNFDEK